MFKSLTFLLAGVLLVLTGFASAADATPAALNFTMKSLDGNDVPLNTYLGKVILVVNVASHCGLTPQYKELEALYTAHEKEGFVILGFPCNQFGQQEPGTPKDIRTFCSSKYSVTFPLFAKIEVNGDGACDLYKYLTALDTKPKGKGPVAWNFEKFLIGRNGEVVNRFAPPTKPNAPEVMSAIQAELDKK